MAAAVKAGRGVGGQGAGEYDPSVFAIADAARNDLVADRVSQSIITSGESGAGKTEACKLILRYLAFLNTHHHHESPRSVLDASSTPDSSAAIERKIILANPLLEAFGNAKTARNPNSSRFGKLIRVLYDAAGRIRGAHVRQYLLELSRVVHHAPTERSFHVFYQLIAGATQSDRALFHILPSPTDYRYLENSDAIPGIDDAAGFAETKDAMAGLGFRQEERDGVFAVLSAVLLLGNLEFVDVEDEEHHECAEVASKEDAGVIAGLLGVEAGPLVAALESRKIKVAGETFVRGYSHAEAVQARDALAKVLYRSLFRIVVARLNDLLETTPEEEGYSEDGLDEVDPELSIAILDQTGFEIFDTNSLEQLLINYSNEKLQVQFHERISSVERKAFAEEGIIPDADFYDPRDTLIRVEALESKTSGILSLLDEECMVPRGNCSNLLHKILDLTSKEFNKYFKVVERAQGNIEGFRFNHFAGPVDYTVSGMLEKNKDQLHDDIKEALASTSNEVLSGHFDSPNPLGSGAGTRKLALLNTTSSNFQPQLQELVEVLNSTAPRYVRCVKPNHALQPGVFDSILVFNQLNNSGILEYIDVRKKGLPVRMRFDRFAEFFKILTGVCDPASADSAFCDRFMETAVGSIEEEQSLTWKNLAWKSGKTKVFMSDDLFHFLEHLRVEKITWSISSMQSTGRALFVRHERRLLNVAVAITRARLAQAARSAFHIERLQSLGRRAVLGLQAVQALKETRVASHCRRAALGSAARRRRVLLEEEDVVEASACMLQSLFCAGKVATDRRRVQRLHCVGRRVEAVGARCRFAEATGRIRNALVAVRAREERASGCQSVRLLQVCERAMRKRAELEVAKARAVLIEGAARQSVSIRALREMQESLCAIQACQKAVAERFAACALKKRAVALESACRSVRPRGMTRAAATSSSSLQPCVRASVAVNELKMMVYLTGALQAVVRRSHAVRRREEMYRSSPLKFAGSWIDICAAVIGPKGTGKTSLVDMLMGGRFEEDSSPSPNSTTTRSFKYADDDKSVFRLYDTPGCDDIGEAKLASNSIRDPSECPITTFVLVDRFDEPRLSSDALRTLTAVYGPSFWSRAVIVLTHAEMCPSDVHLESVLEHKRGVINNMVAGLFNDFVALAPPEVQVIAVSTAKSHQGSETSAEMAKLMNVLSAHQSQGQGEFGFQLRKPAPPSFARSLSQAQISVVSDGASSKSLRDACRNLAMKFGSSGDLKSQGLSKKSSPRAGLAAPGPCPVDAQSENCDIVPRAESRAIRINLQASNKQFLSVSNGVVAANGDGSNLRQSESFVLKREDGGGFFISTVDDMVLMIDEGTGNLVAVDPIHLCPKSVSSTVFKATFSKSGTVQFLCSNGMYLGCTLEGSKLGAFSTAPRLNETFIWNLDLSNTTLAQLKKNPVFVVLRNNATLNFLNLENDAVAPDQLISRSQRVSTAERFLFEPVDSAPNRYRLRVRDGRYISATPSLSLVDITEWDEGLDFAQEFEIRTQPSDGSLRLVAARSAESGDDEQSIKSEDVARLEAVVGADGRLGLGAACEGLQGGFTPYPVFERTDDIAERQLPSMANIKEMADLVMHMASPSFVMSSF